jgi:hypothetical protein
VHRKIRETVPIEPAPPVPAPAPAKQSPAFPPPRTPATQRLRAEVLAEPQSPGFSDLAVLMADAALLEEHLAAPRSPVKQASPPPPVLNIHAAVPETPEPEHVVTVTEQHHTQLDSPASTLVQEPSQLAYLSDTPFAGASQSTSTHVRARTSPEQFPSSREPPSFSSLRMRKPSIPNSHSRNSIGSEMSTESSVVVGRPSSPPTHIPDYDASSVRSSTKSWKSPKKGIGRASSWLFKGKNRSSTLIEGMYYFKFLSIAH